MNKLMTRIVWLAMGLLAVAAAWRFFERPAERGADGSQATPATVQPAAVARVAGGPRKCRRGGEVLYTDGACPPGSREMTLGGGSVTVMPSAAPAAKLKAPAASLPHVRDLLLGDPARDAELRDKRMDAIINR